MLTSQVCRNAAAAQVNHAQPGSSIYNHARMTFVNKMGSF